MSFDFSDSVEQRPSQRSKAPFVVLSLVGLLLAAGAGAGLTALLREAPENPREKTASVPLQAVEKQSPKKDALQEPEPTKPLPVLRVLREEKPKAPPLSPVEAFKKSALGFADELDAYCALAKTDASAKDVERQIDKALGALAMIPGASADLQTEKYPSTPLIRQWSHDVEKYLFYHLKRIATTGKADHAGAVAIAQDSAWRIRDQVSKNWRAPLR